jgi:DNA segregation ATPase FtsK/SpoIIIE, S-DNA-T family
MPRDHRDQIVRRKTAGSSSPGGSRKLLNELAALFLFGFGVVILLALLTYSSRDPSWNATGPQLKADNWIGPVGALLSDTLYQALGYAAILVPVGLFALAWWRLVDPRPSFSGARLLGLGLLGLSLTGLLSLAEACTPQSGAFHSGGWLGHVMICDPNYGFTQFLNTGGSAIVLTVAFLSGLLLATPFSLLGLVMRFTPREREVGVLRVFSERFRAWRQKKEARRERERQTEQGEQAEAELMAGVGTKETRKVTTPSNTPMITIREEAREMDDETKVAKRSSFTTLGLLDSNRKDKPLPVDASETVKAPAQATLFKAAVKVTAPPESGEGERSTKDALPANGKTVAEAGAAAAESQESPENASASSPGLADRVSSRFPRFRLRGRPASDPGANGERAEEEAATGAPQFSAKAHSREANDSAGTVRGSGTVHTELEPRNARTRTLDEMLASATVHRAEDFKRESKVASKPSVKTSLRVRDEFRLPTTDMLSIADARPELADTELRDRAHQLAEKCREFNVAGVVKQISPGPVVTTFEFKLDPGVKYGRVTSLVDDLCLGLKAESIRIDRIPGKSTVGIEVPNHKREVIRLREVIESKKFRDSSSKLTLALGKTIDGTNYVADLARMPHLLIAGATGAGKSVALNAVLLSLIYKATPDEVKVILIDPKRLELGLYSDIPHLLTPIVTDPKRASYALKWAVSEMENRYRHLAAFGVRNIDQYNQIVSSMVDRSLSEETTELPKPLPFLVIIIDELADLMMVSARDVEESITRLAQMARAVGIHLVLATQRPSTDVITGLIKANFPSRISFRVSSKVDSRVIIDTNGAEGLLGQGDMLFLPPGSSRLIRVHGAFVDEQEIKRIADFVRAQGDPDYDERIQLSERELEGDEQSELMRRDEKYDEALRIVIEMGRASTSVLQRRLRIGYGRAASIIDMMHREGLVGPEDGSKPRQVLIAPADRGPFLERLSQIHEEQGVES